MDAVFRGVPQEEAIRRSAACGYRAVEFWGWWGRDLDALEDALGTSSVRLATFCTRFVSLVDRARRSEYIEGLSETLDVAARFGVSRIISQVGSELPDLAREDQQQSIVEGLVECAPMLEKAGVTLLVEPLNLLVDHKGYFLSRSAEAFDIVSAVDNTHVRVLYDIYHQQITEGNLISTIRRHLPLIGHFHAAGNPGRHELTTGEIRYEQVLAELRAAAYEGFVGLEYFPVEDPEAGLMAVASW